MTEQRQRRPRGVAPSLTREIILREALALGDEVGIECVSIRRLAARLGKAPMSLYTYFDSIQQIHQGVLALAFSEVDTSPVPGERWDDTLRRTSASIRAMYLRHARCHLHRIEATGYSAGLERHTQRIWTLHSEQGIPDDTLRRLWRITDAFLGGFVIAELDELERTGELPDPDGREWFETAVGAYSEEAFHDGIEIIIAGTRHLAEPDPCDWRTPLTR